MKFSMNQSFIAQNLQENACLACGFSWSLPLLEGKRFPLATLGWPESPEKSINMPRYELNFRRCVRCGHIYNRSFQYHQVPYVKNPNLMYNVSQIWQEHLEYICQRLVDILPSDAVVVEIGCGKGGFLKRLGQYLPQARLIGFDPNLASEFKEGPVEIYSELFVPAIHLESLKPDLVLSRHVLEHLMNPLSFLQNLLFFAAMHDVSPYLFFEVPCVDRVLEYGRIEDLYYEHNSHFTRRSFETMCQQLTCDIQCIETAYNDEVIYALLSPHQSDFFHQSVRETLNFHHLARNAQEAVPVQIKSLIENKKQIALWGGTGKGAAFIHHFGLEDENLPLRVVDSDQAKVGTYVPGSQYRIESKESLVTHPVDVMIITAQWRAEDIVLEILDSNLKFEQILLEHHGKLCDFFADKHPYKTENFEKHAQKA